MSIGSPLVSGGQREKGQTSVTKSWSASSRRVGDTPFMSTACSTGVKFVAPRIRPAKNVALIAIASILRGEMEKSNRPIAVDLCCGVGGMSLGFEQAGFEVLAAVDIEAIHVSAHQQNFPNCRTWRADLAEISGDDIRTEAGLGDSSIDVVFAGVPCEGFSLIGRRCPDDPRNLVLFEFARLVGELGPSYWVLENVEGIQLGAAKSVFGEFLKRVRDIGYCYVDPIRVLNAAEFGVPQLRRRVFVLGYMKGLKAPAYPKPIYAIGRNGDHAGPTVWDAIGDLPVIDKYKYLLSADEFRGALGQPSDYAKILRGEVADRDDLSPRRERSGAGLTGCMRTVHTPKTVARFSNTKQGRYEEVSRFYRLAKEGLAKTLRAGTGPAQGSFMAPRPIHPFQDRCISVREAARLQSFPDWFSFHPAKWHAFRQIGNSVPPLLARAVAASVRRALSVSRAAEVTNERHQTSPVRVC
jgi:DNA (cytosine-5)-methyltransferase 1